MANNNKMTIIEALVQLRNDLKLWVTNNLRVKQNKNLGVEENGKFLTVNEQGDIVATEIDATTTELGYMKGVTSNVQAQLNDKVTTTYVNEAVKDKLDKNLGAEEKDKFLTVDEQGDIVTTEIETIINSEIDEIFEGAFYSISYNLLNCTSSSTEEEIYNNEKFDTVITPNTGYKIENISITVGTEDVTQSVRDNNIITIPSVIGNIVITATAVPFSIYTITYNLTNCSSSNTETTITERDSYTSSISCVSPYIMNECDVNMEGEGEVIVNRTGGKNYNIDIPEVTGNIIITAIAEN